VIVRILGEGQYSLSDEELGVLESLDSTMADAVDTDDAASFTRALAALIAEVREKGEPLADDDFAPSDLVVPFADATLEETRELLAEQAEGSRNQEDRGRN
jgi:hypothetical protein